MSAARVLRMLTECELPERGYALWYNGATDATSGYLVGWGPELCDGADCKLVQGGLFLVIGAEAGSQLQIFENYENGTFEPVDPSGIPAG